MLEMDEKIPQNHAAREPHRKSNEGETSISAGQAGESQMAEGTLLPHPKTSGRLHEDAPPWRDEVAWRVRAHRVRRPRAAPAKPSLRFNFEKTEDADAERVENSQTMEPRLLSFPRVAAEPPSSPVPAVEELAEPVVSDKPRILEATEEVKQAIVPSTLFDVRLEAEAEDEDEEPRPRVSKAPVEMAPMGRRIFSAMMDWLIVLAATSIFAIIVVTMTQKVPLSKAAILLGLFFPAVFWATYQYLFLVYAGFTPGMQMAQLEVSTFEGKSPTIRQRQGRALAMTVSCMSMGMGFLWALMDEDRLGWHDRITRTHLRIIREG